MLGFAQVIWKDTPCQLQSSQPELKHIGFFLLGYKGIARARRDAAEIQLHNGNLDETVAASLSPLCNSTQTLAG